MPNDSDQISVLVTAPEGLHARPAIKLARLAKRFKSQLWVRAIGGDEWIDAKSLVRVMALKVEEGTHLEFRASGEDSQQALAEISAMVERNFDEHGKA